MKIKYAIWGALICIADLMLVSCEGIAGQQ